MRICWVALIILVNCVSQDILIMPQELLSKRENGEIGHIKFRIKNQSGVNYKTLKLERICLALNNISLSSVDCTVSNFENIDIDVSTSSYQTISVPTGEYVGLIQIRGGADFENIYLRITFGDKSNGKKECKHEEMAKGFNFLDIDQCDKLKILSGKITEIDVEITDKFESFFGEALFIGIISFGMASPQMNIRHVKSNLKNP